MRPDFSGYATRAGIRCSDGRTILPDAFKDNDGSTVPLVWQHGHHDPDNVLGHAALENRDDGVYAYGFFNHTAKAQNAKQLVQHGDITSLSIYANQLVEKEKNVMHGQIREVSLVLSGANPGAKIDNVVLRHSDGGETELQDEAVIYGGTLSHGDGYIMHDDDDEAEDIQAVLDSLTPEQQEIVGALLENAAAQGYEAGVEDAVDEDDFYDEDEGEYEDDDYEDDDYDYEEDDFEPEELAQYDYNGDAYMGNVFDQGRLAPSGRRPVLSHSDMADVFKDAQEVGSLKESVLFHADQFGITNIDLLFPQAKDFQNKPEFIKRRTEWVDGVMNGVTSAPFTRVRSVHADITQDEARAKGYIKGTMKKDEFFELKNRSTGPTTVYKRQKVNRDDMLDITTFDAVAWIKAEMLLMLHEEIASAILFGDNRDIESPDYINAKNIRPIATDHEFFTHRLEIAQNDIGTDAMIELIDTSRHFYKGSGQPALYTTESVLGKLRWIKDKDGRRIYPNDQAIADAMRVSKIVTVETMERVPNLVGLIVNLSDYQVGTDQGGKLGMFDQFDIDYNQHKYLIETRMSGALVRAKSAMALWKTGSPAATGDGPTNKLDPSRLLADQRHTKKAGGGGGTPVPPPGG